MLSVKAVSAGYEGKMTVRDVNLEIPEGQVRVVLGANGSGKSTLLRAISGLLPCSEGDISLGEVSLRNKTPYMIASMGVGHCLEGRRIFPYLSVRDNLEVGAYLAKKTVAREMKKRVLELFPVLENKERQKASTLSGGERQMLAVGQTLMSNPRFLLLDEPSAGLSPLYVSELAKAIRRISMSGTGVLWAEQNARIALDESDFAYLLSEGCVSFSGLSCEIKDLDLVKKAYLGI